MTHATLLCAIWQDLLRLFAWAFPPRGYRRFLEWITAMATNVQALPLTVAVTVSTWRRRGSHTFTGPNARAFGVLDNLCSACRFDGVSTFGRIAGLRIPGTFVRRGTKTWP